MNSDSLPEHRWGGGGRGCRSSRQEAEGLARERGEGAVGRGRKRGGRCRTRKGEWWEGVKLGEGEISSGKGLNSRCVHRK